jgi:predicted nucleic acid-binding protein
VAHDLAAHFAGINPKEALELVAIHAEAVDAPPLTESVCTDPDDDKFLACAITSRTLVITTGDKALLRTSGYAGIEVLTPRAFVAKYLSCP